MRSVINQMWMVRGSRHESIHASGENVGLQHKEKQAIIQEHQAEKRNREQARILVEILVDEIEIDCGGELLFVPTIVGL